MADQQPVVLESNVPLSRSLIWGLQRDFYMQRGLKAWTDDRVPNFITNNPFISEIYSKIVFGFVCDCDGLSAQEPLRILELGAGTGKFSYLFLRHLTNLLHNENMGRQAVRYCMTDCSAELIQSWRNNSYLAEFLENGTLEFDLLQVGEKIERPFLNRKGPLAVIANYVFDSLPQDAFIIKDGQISEDLLTTSASSESQTVDLSRLQFSWTNADLPPSRYTDASWNHILELYRRRLSAATLLFPSHALQVLQDLGRWSDGSMLVLAADKGFTNEDSLLFLQGEPQLEFHGANCFSQMVNFDAISKYFQAIGGEALFPDKHFSNLSICAFLQKRSQDEFTATKRAYREAQAAVGPDDVFTLFAWLNAHMEEMTVPQILSALKLTRWDPVALLRLFPVLGRQLRNVATERHDLRNAVMNTWANHYPVTQNENLLAFDCGVILLELRFFEEALSMFKVSQQVLGATAATSYNLGLCSLGLGRTSEALTFMTDACNMDPQFDPARTMRRKLEGQNVQG